MATVFQRRTTSERREFGAASAVGSCADAGGASSSVAARASERWRAVSIAFPLREARFSYGADEGRVIATRVAPHDELQRDRPALARDSERSGRHQPPGVVAHHEPHLVGREAG